MSENQEVLQNCSCRRLASRLLGVASPWSLEHLGGLIHEMAGAEDTHTRRQHSYWQRLAHLTDEFAEKSNEANKFSAAAADVWHMFGMPDSLLRK
ncbi:hypothetical protein DKX38_016443 [Salix brachista]|uniref:Uncharacterized protein n=1 Tax=Salix brachista TaxID=2182728 RepID=A0A5N5L8K4_9ROSI|nr:hypothetical protein DKX38_016443 [Salix brachista]